MACEDFQEELSAWVDGELTATEHARLAAHLDTCAQCGELLRQFQSTSALLRKLPTPAAPAFVTDAAMRLVRAMPRPAGEPWLARLHRVVFEPFFPKLAVAAAGFAAAVVVAVLVVRAEFVKNDAGTTESASALQQTADEGYRLASAPPEATGVSAPAKVYDFRDPKTHGRRDVGTFNESERASWQRGAWHHERRFGRDGWWWEVDGAWYWYEQAADGPPVYVSEVRYPWPPARPN